MLNLSQLPVRGTVYGTLLNEKAALAALGEQVHAAPYKAPPQAPILYIKPRNTLLGQGEAVVVPAEFAALEMGATLAVVIGQTASHVSVADALSYVAGYTVMNDISVPHDSFYRPSIRFKCRDGFCPIGSVVVPRAQIQNPDDLKVTVSIDHGVVQQSSTGNRVRSVAKLLADVTEFMTLHPGDVLSIGIAAGSPLATAGQQVRIEIEGVGVLENSLVAEASV